MDCGEEIVALVADSRGFVGKNTLIRFAYIYERILELERENARCRPTRTTAVAAVHFPYQMVPGTILLCAIVTLDRSFCPKTATSHPVFMLIPHHREMQSVTTDSILILLIEAVHALQLSITALGYVLTCDHFRNASPCHGPSAKTCPLPGVLQSNGRMCSLSLFCALRCFCYILCRATRSKNVSLHAAVRSPLRSPLRIDFVRVLV